MPTPQSTGYSRARSRGRGGIRVQLKLKGKGLCTPELLRDLSSLPCLACEFCVCHKDILRRGGGLAHAKFTIKLAVFVSKVVYSRIQPGPENIILFITQCVQTGINQGWK